MAEVVDEERGCGERERELRMREKNDEVGETADGDAHCKVAEEADDVEELVAVEAVESSDEVR